LLILTDRNTKIYRITRYYENLGYNTVLQQELSRDSGEVFFTFSPYSFLNSRYLSSASHASGLMKVTYFQDLDCKQLSGPPLPFAPALEPALEVENQAEIFLGQVGLYMKATLFFH
jgi:hypothetical protein